MEAIAPEKRKYNELFYAATAPTQLQAKRLYWDDLKLLTKPYWSKRPNESELTIHVNDCEGGKTRLIVAGLDAWQRLEGLPWSGIIVDEMRYVNSDAIAQTLRPAIADRQGWLWRCGTPGGRSTAYYEAVLDTCEGHIPETVAGGTYYINREKNSGYFTWWSEDIVPQTEIEAAKRELDPLQFEQEFLGSFVTLSSEVFYGFSYEDYPQGNVDDTITYNERIPVQMFVDFNVNPLTCALGHIVTDRESGERELRIFREYYLRNSYTVDLCGRILADYPNTRVFSCTSCQSGKARQTSQAEGKSDREIIRQEFQNAGREVLFRHRSKNPYQRTMTNASNALLSHRRVRIHPQCKELITDYTVLGYNEKGGIDDRDPKRGHLSDAVGYGIEYHFPLQSAGGLTNPNYIF